MTIKFTPIFSLSFLLIVVLNIPTMGQMCTGKTKDTAPNISVAEHVPTNRIRINIPSDYKPPLADEKLITFPETVATKKKQKQLLRKRKKLKRAKKQGCIATHL